jgi:hypothetical protein
MALPIATDILTKPLTQEKVESFCTTIFSRICLHKQRRRGLFAALAKQDFGGSWAVQSFLFVSGKSHLT